jgi:hypothetical protein
MRHARIGVVINGLHGANLLRARHAHVAGATKVIIASVWCAAANVVATSSARYLRRRGFEHQRTYIKCAPLNGYVAGASALLFSSATRNTTAEEEGNAVLLSSTMKFICLALGALQR